MPANAPNERRWAVLLSLLVLFSSAIVPLSAATTGTDQANAFESFEVEFESAEPEAPDDVVVRWTLTDDATDVNRLRIAFVNENDETINLFKPNDTDVPNPFSVAATDGRNGSADIVVDDLTSATLQLKVPVGHCDRVDEVQVFADGDDDAVTEPDIRKGVSCGPGTDTGQFAVSIDDYDDNVTAGENVTVTGTVENTGETEATQDVRFLVDGEKVDVMENVTLPGGQATNVSFVYGTADDDVPEITVAVESDDDIDERTVSVTEGESDPGSEPDTDPESTLFAVSIDDYDDNVTAGENVTVTGTVENTGETEATQDVRFLVDGEQAAVAENLTLSGNQSEAFTFVYGTADDDVPEITVAVESDDDADERTVGVDEPDPPFFAVTIENASAEVAAGETVAVDVRVENAGDSVGTQTVSLTGFDGKTVDSSEPLTLTAGESVSVTLHWATESTDVGTGTVTVGSENETGTAAVTVTEPAVDAINATLEETELETGEETSITVEATFTDGSTHDVTENATFTALDTDVASVAADGTVTAEGDGTTEIQAAFGNETDADTLRVEGVDSGDSDRDRRDRSGDDDGDNGADGDEGGEGDSDPSDPEPTYEGDTDRPADGPTDEDDDVGTVTDADSTGESDGTDTGVDESDTEADDADADKTEGVEETGETTASSIVVSPGLGLLLLAALVARRRR